MRDFSCMPHFFKVFQLYLEVLLTCKLEKYLPMVLKFDYSRLKEFSSLSHLACRPSVTTENHFPDSVWSLGKPAKLVLFYCVVLVFQRWIHMNGLSHEPLISVSRTSHVFLTSVSWMSVSCRSHELLMSVLCLMSVSWTCLPHKVPMSVSCLRAGISCLTATKSMWRPQMKPYIHRFLDRLSNYSCPKTLKLLSH